MDNLEIMLILTLLVVVGYIAHRCNYMGGDFDKKLSGLIVDFTCPALILSSVMGDRLPSREMILPLLGIGFLTYILLTVVAIYVPRLITKKTEDQGILGFAMMFGNVGFIGYPIVASIFGQEAVFYAAILNVPNTLFVFTVGNMLLHSTLSYTETHSEVRPQNSLKNRFDIKILYCPAMIAAYLAMLIVATGIDNTPAIISRPLTLLGNITIPGALLIIGSSMASLPIRKMVGNLSVYLTTILRLLVIPISIHLLFTAIGFQPLSVAINTVIIAMPVATYGTIFCLKEGIDVTVMTEVTFISTIVSIATVPMITLLFI